MLPHDLHSIACTPYILACMILKDGSWSHSPAQLPGLCFLLELVLPALVWEWSEGSTRLCRSAVCCVCSASSRSGKGACTHLLSAQSESMPSSVPLGSERALQTLRLMLWLWKEKGTIWDCRFRMHCITCGGHCTGQNATHDGLGKCEVRTAVQIGSALRRREVSE